MKKRQGKTVKNPHKVESIPCKSQVFILQKSVKELGIHLGLHYAEGQIKVTINACCPENIKIVKAYSGMIYLLLEIYAKFWS